MLERDYIMRLIRMFFEALEKYIRGKQGKEPELIQRELSDMFKTFLKHPRDYYDNKSMEEIIESFPEDERLFRVEIVAELFYQDALLKDDDPVLLRKAWNLFKYVDLNSETFSIDRQRKMSEIELLIH